MLVARGSSPFLCIVFASMQDPWTAASFIRHEAVDICGCMCNGSMAQKPVAVSTSYACISCSKVTNCRLHNTAAACEAAWPEATLPMPDVSNTLSMCKAHSYCQVLSTASKLHVHAHPTKPTPTHQLLSLAS